MAKHKGDMLEALRETLRNAREETQETAPAAGGHPQRPAPEKPAPPAERPAPPEASVQRPAPAGRPVQKELDELDRRIAAAQAQQPRTLILALHGLALVLMFLLGRFTAPSTVLAEAPEEDPQGGERILEEDSSGARTPRVEPRRATQSEALETLPTNALLTPSADPARDDRMFQDSSNTHSVLAITYDDSEANKLRAFEVYDDLRARGFPAVRPLVKGARLVIFVGAARGQGPLEDLRARIAQCPGPRGVGRPYQTALVSPIASYQFN